ncbi:AAA family ATPase [Microbispora hainanensis]|uniref:AAA family ATPase n=1 Tax=Microbispora hainanensis TaxID=568844 RepID=UPI00340F411B
MVQGLLTDRCRFGELSADIHWFDPNPHTLRLQVDDCHIRFHLDQKPMPFLPTPYHPIVVRSPRRHLTDLSDLAALLDLDVASFLNLLTEVPARVDGQVSRVEVAGDAPLVHLRSWPEPALLRGHPHPGAAWIVLFETAIALAQVQSQAGPTLLLIDDFGEFLHPKLVNKMFKLLTDRTQGFQTVVVTHNVLPVEVQRHWSITTFGYDTHHSLLFA